ncbi:hypothetical protein WJX74_006530 [Apatococcus lobatus]|uniref:Uncharacterized protein n=1 Tax=Apatococcus lobatus TaxID=904363 RepID=A0AAW1QI61_9CHLO
MEPDEAFSAFDFEADPRWRQYWNNLELPAGIDEAKARKKYKAKWYQREVDPAFEPNASGPASNAAPGGQPASASTSAGTTSTHPSPQPTPPSAPGQAAKSSSKTSGGAAGRSASGLGQRLQRMLDGNRSQLLLFSLHATLLLLAVLHLQPLQRPLSYAAWSWFLQLAVFKYAYKVYLKAGLPRLRPFPAAIKGYLQQVAATTDFQYALMNVLFLPQRPMMLVMVPTVVLSTYHAFAFMASNFGQTHLWRVYGSRAHAWLFSQQQSAIMYNAAAEIGVGFLVIISVFSNLRNILFVWLYWNFLRMRYFTPDASTYHQLVWGQLELKTAPVFQMVPMLRVPLSLAKRWFLSLAQPAAR